MPRSIPAQPQSQQVRSLDEIGPAADRVGPGLAKAGLKSDRVGLAFTQVQADAIVRCYGSVKAAAFALGEVDPSLMQREFKAGNFSRFDAHADSDAKGYVAHALAEAFGKGSRYARIQQLKRTVEESLNEMVMLAAS